MMDSIKNLGQDRPLAFLLNKFIEKLEASGVSPKYFSKCFFDNPSMLVIPGDADVITHLESQVKNLLLDQQENIETIQNYNLPVMYEFYEEKKLSFHNKFRRDIFKKYVKPRWLTCYEILTDIIEDSLSISMPDLQPCVEKNIRVRVSKSWMEPFSKITE